MEKHAIQDVLNDADVICATVSFDFALLGDQQFDLLVIDEACRTSAEHVWAIGEVASWNGECLGLVAPANTMAEIVADRLAGGRSSFDGFDTATKLKLSGR